MSIHFGNMIDQSSETNVTLSLMLPVIVNKSSQTKNRKNRQGRQVPPTGMSKLKQTKINYISVKINDDTTTT